MYSSYANSLSYDSLQMGVVITPTANTGASISSNQQQHLQQLQHIQHIQQQQKQQQLQQQQKIKAGISKHEMHAFSQPVNIQSFKSSGKHSFLQTQELRAEAEILFKI